MKAIRCKRCGGTFESETHNAQYCPVCRTIIRKQKNKEGYEKKRLEKLALRGKVECIVCGEMFEPTSSRQKTCSDVCQQHYKHNQRIMQNKKCYKKRKEN